MPADCRRTAFTAYLLFTYAQIRAFEDHLIEKIHASFITKVRCLRRKNMRTEIATE